MSNIFRPPKSTNPADYLGFHEVAIMNVLDRKEDFDWADVYLEISVRSQMSKYNDKIILSGEFKRDSNLNLESNPLLGRIYGFLDGVGLSCGLDITGNWITDDGIPIPDIAAYMNKRILSVDDDGNPFEYPFVAYIYQEKAKQGDKLYTRVHQHIYPASEKGLETLKSRIAFLKSKGYLKEASSSSLPSMSPMNNDELVDAF